MRTGAGGDMLASKGWSVLYNVKRMSRRNSEVVAFWPRLDQHQEEGKMTPSVE